MSTRITRDQLRAAIENGTVTVVDALPAAPYSRDANCGRGEGLAERLESLGYAGVRVYRDGIEDWVAAGLPVEGGS